MADNYEDLFGICPLGGSPTTFGQGLFPFSGRRQFCDRGSRSTCIGCWLGGAPFPHGGRTLTKLLGRRRCLHSPRRGRSGLGN